MAKNGTNKEVKRKEHSRARRVLLTAVRWFLGSAFLACVYHLGLSLIFSTDSERQIHQENRLYEKLYPEMREQERMLRDVVEGLELRDDELYMNVFNTSAPSMSDLTSGNVLGDDADNLAEQDIFTYVRSKSDRVIRSAQTVEDNFRRIFELCSEEGYSLPPMTMPLEGFSIARTGASIGLKISPFYKVATSHDGLDLIAPAGTPVLAGGAGVVVKVVHGDKIEGNVVYIDHGNGYTTRYSHLAEIRVASGRKVLAGTRIGSVGMTGKSFAPHLHYAVLHDGEVCDPVNYLFSSISPEDYATMLVLSSATGQQMD